MEKRVYYHCSPVSGITILEPRKPVHFDKPGRVYMTSLLPMALMYGIRNFEYTYGYTKEGQIYLDEYFQDALLMYKGQSASLYICDPEEAESTRIPNEWISSVPVPVLEEIRIPDVYEALLEEEKKGSLVICRYHTLSEGKRKWIFEAEKREILENGLLNTDSPRADYMRLHYPESWQAAEKELNR